MGQRSLADEGFGCQCESGHPGTGRVECVSVPGAAPDRTDRQHRPASGLDCPKMPDNGRPAAVDSQVRIGVNHARSDR